MATKIIQSNYSAISNFMYVARKITGTFRVKQRKHDKVWDIIFPNKKWLFVASEMGLIPALVGQDVRNLHSGSHERGYIVLVTGDHSGELRKLRELLLKCLRIDNKKRRFDRKTQEVVLEEFNITLNIEDAYLSAASIRMDPRQLFSEHRISSAALFWCDCNLRTIHPDDVVGIGGKACNLESVASWCGVELTHPKMRVIRGARWNQIFENPRLPLNVKPIRGTDRFVEGWDLVR